MSRLKTLCLLLISAAFAQAQAPTTPAAPSNFRVKALGVNSFQLDWSDNSKNESGWDIRISAGKTDSPAQFQYLASPNITTHVVSLDREFPGTVLSFQLAAYSGDGTARRVSKPTSVVQVETPAKSTFGAPSNFTAETIDDGRIRIKWKDNSNSEAGYQVEFKAGDGEWKVFGNTEPGTTFNLPAGGLEPNTRYSFRTRAFKAGFQLVTGYSNTATATTRSFLKPIDLAAKTEGEGAVSMTWKDRSSIENNYEIQWKAGTGAWTSLGEAGRNSSATGKVTGFSLNTEYKFRIRAYRIVGTSKVYTRFSNVVTVTTTPLARPTGLAGTVLSDTSVRLDWTDRSNLEFGFLIQGREAGETDFTTYGNTGANARQFTISGLKPGRKHEFRVRAFDFFSSSDYTPFVELTTRDGFVSDLHPPIFWNTSFSHEIKVSRPSTLTSLVVGDLPQGLSYDPETRTISGTTQAEGVRKVSVTATYQNGYVLSRMIALRIIRAPGPPVANGSFNALDLAPGGTSRVALAGRFSDPDTQDARRVSTSKGDFDIILYPLATPITVGNFLDYVDQERYEKVFFHRSMPDFVVQTGGYRYGPSTGYRKVEQFPAIANEAGISNVKGTVAMAKVEGDPDSATSEFFVNMVDGNASNLDFQNSGFTVFGRVAGDGMDVVNAINDLPRASYTLSIDGASRTLGDFPVNSTSAPATLDPDLLVKLNSIRPVDIIRHSVTSDNSAVATATISNNEVVVTAVAAGTTNIQVKATDLDGNSTTRPIAVTVTAAE